MEHYPELCALAEGLVSGITGPQVTQCRDRKASPRCALRMAARQALRGRAEMEEDRWVREELSLVLGDRWPISACACVSEPGVCRS